MEEVAAQAVSLGIAGLLFVMWWHERQERARAAAAAQDAAEHTRRAGDVSDHLIDVVRTNTDALAALREELRSHRMNETEWLGRLSRQLERLCEAAPTAAR